METVLSLTLDKQMADNRKSYYWAVVNKTDSMYGLDYDGLEAEPVDGTVNYFTLSEGGELSYTPATTGNVISFGEDNPLAIDIYMNGFPTFSIANGLKDQVDTCNVRIQHAGAKVSNLGEGYTLDVLPSSLSENESFTVDNTKFVYTGDDWLELRMVGKETPTAAIKYGSVYLSKADDQNTYSGSEGGSVTYEYTGDVQDETAVAKFEGGVAKSITGLDEVGEKVTVKSKDAEGGTKETTYEKTKSGLIRTIGGESRLYTGDEVVDTKTNVLDLTEETDWTIADTRTPLTDPEFTMTLFEGKYYAVTTAAGSLMGVDDPPASGDYFKVENGTIRYASKNIKLSGKVTMNVDAPGLIGSLDLYRGEENGATFTYKVTSLGVRTVTNVGEGDTFETSGSGDFTFATAKEPAESVSFKAETSATFCVDDSTVAITSGTVQLSSGNKLYASGSDPTSSTDNVKVALTGKGDDVDVEVENGEVTGIRYLDDGEIVTVTSEKDGEVTYEKAAYGIKRTQGGVNTFYTGADASTTNVLNITAWIDSTTLDNPTFDLKLGKTYYEVKAAGELTGSDEKPTSGNYFQVDNQSGSISYVSTTEGLPVKLSGKVTMKVNASDFAYGSELKLYRGEENGATFTYNVTNLKDLHWVSNVAKGDTFETAGSGFFRFQTAKELVRFTVAEGTAAFCVDDANVAIKNGTVELSTGGELFASGSKAEEASDNEKVTLTVAGDSEAIEGSVKVAVTNGKVESITGIDQAGEIVKVKNDKGETTYGLDDIGIYKETSDSKAYYTKETAEGGLGAVDVIKADESDWTACTKVTLTNPTIAITPESDETSYYIVSAPATGSTVTASKLTGELTKEHNYFTVTNDEGTYSLTYTESALKPINLVGTVTVDLNGSKISEGSAFELYHPKEEGAAKFIYNVTNLKISSVTNVAQGDTFETAGNGQFRFETAGESETPFDFNVTTGKAAFCADESTVAIQSGTVQLSSGDEVFASGSKADDSSDNVSVELTGEGDVDESVKVEVTDGEVKSITGLDKGEIVTYHENDTTTYTTFKVVGSTIIKTVIGGGEKKITKLNTEGNTGDVDLISSTNWVSNKSTMGSVSLEFGLTGSEQYWTLSGDKVTKVTTGKPSDDQNYFKLSNTGELTYTFAKKEEADIIKLSADSKVTLKVDMREGGDTPKFSVNGDLANNIIDCEITGKKGATVTGFADNYTFKAEGLEENDSVTINDQKFIMAVNGALELSDVITTNDLNGSKAKIANGAIKLGVKGEGSTNEYYSTKGSRVIYDEEQGSEEVEPDGATVKFENGEVSSITGIDVAGEIVKVKIGDVETTYGLDTVGIYKETGPKDKAYYTGTVVDDDYGKVDVIGASKTKTDWTAYTEVNLTNPTITITPESGETSYYLVKATNSATGSRVTAAKLTTGEPTSTQNYFMFTSDNAGTYKITYNTSNFNPINLSGKVTVNFNGSKLGSGDTFDLHHPQAGDGAATFTYNVTALKGAVGFTNVSSGDTFAAAAGSSCSFTMVMKDEAQSYSVTAASNFVADESAVAMYSGTATLDSTYKELVASGKDKTATSDNVKVEFTAGSDDKRTATVKVVNGVVTSITGLQKDDSVKITANDKTATYTKTSTGFTRTIGDESAAYTGTITDIITAISKEKEWYALGNVEFKDGVVLDLGTVTADSYYTLTKITDEGATVQKVTTGTPSEKENYFTVSKDGEVSYHQATGEGTTIAKADASQAKVKFAAQNLDTLTLSGQGEQANGVKNYVVSGVKKDATVDGVVAGDVLKTLGSATVNGFEYKSTAGALEIRGLAIDVGNDVEPGDEINAEDDTLNQTALYSGTVNVIGDPEDDEEPYSSEDLTVGGGAGATETVTITSDPKVTTTKTGAVVTAKDGAITVIKDLEKGETITHTHGNVTDTYTYNGTSIIKTTGENTYTYDVAAAKNTNVLTIKGTQWENVTGGIAAGEKTALNITLPATITGEDGAFYEVTGSKSTNIKVAATASKTRPDGSNYFQFSQTGEGIYSLEYIPAEDASGSFSIRLGAAQVNINATALASGSTLNLSGTEPSGVDGVGFLPTYNVTGLKARTAVTSDEADFTVTTAALKAKETIKIDGKTYTAGANGALKFEKDGDSVVFQSGTLKIAGEDEVTARYVSRAKQEGFATIKSTGTDGVLLTATAAGGLTVKDLEKNESVTIQVDGGEEYTYQLDGDKLTRTKDGVTYETYTGAAKFAATADVFAAINTDKWVATYTVEAYEGEELALRAKGVNGVGKSAITYYEVELEDSQEDGYDKKVKSIGSAVDTVPTGANYFAVTATGAVTYHSNEYQKADLSNATVRVDYNYAETGAKFTTVARPKDATTANKVGSYKYVGAKAGMTFTGLTQADIVRATLDNNEKVTVNGTAFTAVGAPQGLDVGIIKNELNKEVAALKSPSTILVKGTYYVATSSDGSYAKVVSTGNGVNVTFDNDNGIKSISGFDKNEKIEVYTPEGGTLPKTANITYQVNAAGTMVIKSENGNPTQQAALGENNTIDVNGAHWEALAFSGSATLTLNDKTTADNYGVDTKLYNSATAAATIIKTGDKKTTVGTVVTNGGKSFTADGSFEGNVKITTSGKDDWVLTGSKGNDTFTLGTETTFKGSNGNDTITSSAKEDYFDYEGAGLAGTDVIKSFTSTATVVDCIGVAEDGVLEAASTGTDVKLTIGGKTVSIVGAVGKEFDVERDGEVTAYIVGNSTKANTFTLTNTQLGNESKSYKLIGGSANDTFKVANNSTDILTLDLRDMESVEIFTAAGSKGAVDIKNADEFVSITGGNAGDTITAGLGTSWISGGKGNDSIDFGNAHPVGKTYQLNAGDGIDTIVNFDKTKDKIYLGKGAVTSVTSSEEGGVSIQAGADSVVLKDVTNIKDIKNNLYTSAGKQISDAWYYNSGTVLPTGATFAGNTITLSTKFEGSSFNLTSITDFGGWVAASGNKSLDINGTAVKTALLIKGSDEDNIIKAGGKVGVGVTSIDGGKGNDTLYGGAGTDVFIFEDGYGEDTVNNFINGKDVVSLTSSANLEHTTNGANLTINTGEDDSITLIGKANTRVDILDANATSVVAASDYSTAYYFGKTNGTNTYNVNAKDMLNAHFFGSDDAKDTLTITANGALLTGSALKETVDGKSYINVDLTDDTKFKSIDELNAQAVSSALHVKSDSKVVDEEEGTMTTTTIKAGKGSDIIECAAGKDIIYYGGYGFGDDSISGFDVNHDKLWVANTIKSVAALEDGVKITFVSGKNESTLTVMGEGVTVEALNGRQAVIASATATASASSWNKAYSAYIDNVPLN